MLCDTTEMYILVPERKRNRILCKSAIGFIHNYKDLPASMINSQGFLLLKLGMVTGDESLVSCSNSLFRFRLLLDDVLDTTFSPLVVGDTEYCEEEGRTTTRLFLGSVLQGFLFRGKEACLLIELGNDEVDVNWLKQLFIESGLPKTNNS